LEKKFLDEFKVAEEFLVVAKNNLNSSLRTSANRIYFAFEKAVIAYLSFLNLKVSKNHKKIWEISAKELGEEYYSLFRELYDLRMQADYGAASIIVPFNNHVISQKIFETEALINKIKNKLDIKKNEDKG
jgi:hypothetical protein